MKSIPLTNGYTASIDDADFERVNQFRWTALVSPWSIYAVARTIPGSRKRESLHRFILGISDPLVEVDHINHDGLDCQRTNMRSVTKAQNRANCRKNKSRASSNFKGVSWHTQRNKWRARIEVKDKEHALGCFVQEEDAARAYDVAALQHFGEFALLNFPQKL